MNAKRKTNARDSSPSWKEHLSSYADKRVLRFQSAADLDAAIELLWTDALRTLPHASPDGESLVVPAEAVPYFTQAGIKFTSTKLRNIGELTPEEIRRLRR